MSQSINDRYFSNDDQLEIDPVSGEKPVKLKYHTGGRWMESTTDKYMPCYNPSTGAVIAYAPQCTSGEVEDAIQAAVKAYPKWANTPVGKRAGPSALQDEGVDRRTPGGADVYVRQGRRQEMGRGHG